MTELAEIELAMKQLSHSDIRLLILRAFQYLDANETQSAKATLPEEANNFRHSPDATPIWEVAAQIAAKVPEEEWKKVPTDLAANFDYYQKQQAAGGLDDLVARAEKDIEEGRVKSLDEIIGDT